MKALNQQRFENASILTQRPRRPIASLLISVLLALGSASHCSEAFPELDGGDLIIYSLVNGDNRKFIFATQSTYNGDLRGTQATGVAGADAICVTEKNANFSSLPGAGSEYKALLVSADRRACSSANCTTSGAAEHLDWVLAANTEYLNPDSQTIFTTNSNGVINLGTTPLTRSFPVSSDYWTGVATAGDWTTGFDTCSNWSDPTAGSDGMRGTQGATNTTALGDFAKLDSCDTPYRFLCVRQ